MSLKAPASDCVVLSWDAIALSDPGQVAVEDYARAFLRATAAEVVLDADGRIVGVHVCGVAAEPAEAARADVTAFARDLARRQDGGGLGWSSKVQAGPPFRGRHVSASRAPSGLRWERRPRHP
jgi:hypothetical protein